MTAWNLERWFRPYEYILGKMISTSSKSSIITLTGVSCGLIALRRIFHLFFHEVNVPGYWALCTAVQPMYWFIAGLAIRAVVGNTRWWMNVSVAAMVIVLVLAEFFPFCCWTHPYSLALSVAGIGFLVPESFSKGVGRVQGWISLAFSLVSALAYTGTVIVEERLLWGKILLPEFWDMQELMVNLMVDIEPMLWLIMVLFILMFSYSPQGMNLTGQKWVRISVLVAAILSLLPLSGYFRFWTPIVVNGRWWYIFWLHPLIVFAVLALFRYLIKTVHVH